MINFLKNINRNIFYFLFFLSILPFFGFLSNKNVVKNSRVEMFNSDLSRINSMNKAINYTDSIYSAENNGAFDTLKYIKVVSKFTKERFYHGLSHYSIFDNWIAYLSGKILWSHMSAIVNPEDILKHSEGLCSQQTIVFMEMLMRKGIKVRSVGLGYKEGPGHFLSEVYCNGSWHLYDVSLEPNWKKIAFHHESMKYYLSHKDSLYVTYQETMPKKVFDKLITNVKYGKENDFPAKKMLWFHQITYVITYLIPLFFLILIIISYRYKNCTSLYSSKPPEYLEKVSESVEQSI